MGKDLHDGVVVVWGIAVWESILPRSSPALTRNPLLISPLKGGGAG